MNMWSWLLIMAMELEYNSTLTSGALHMKCDLRDNINRYVLKGYLNTILSAW